MSTPNQSELTFYTNKLLDDNDWRNNFLKMLQWITDGSYDLTTNSLTTTNGVTVGGNIIATGNVTANTFYGDGSNITGLNINNKNFIINGAATINQRVTAYTLSAGVYGISGDRFYGMANGTAVSAGTFTTTTSANIGRAKTAFKFNGVTITGSGFVYLRYRMESKDAKNFNGQSASFSCKVYHNVGSDINYTVYIRKADVVDDFSAVTAVSSSSANIVPTATETDIVFENVSMGDVSTGIEIEVKVECGTITLKSFEFTEIQFEISDAASEFEYKNVGIELASCERYYESRAVSFSIISVDTGYTGNRAVFSTTFTTTKRITPTVVLSSLRVASAGSYTDYSPYTPGPGEFYVYVNGFNLGFSSASPGVTWLIAGDFTATAEL